MSEAVTGSARLAVSPAVRAQQTAAAVLAALPSGQAPEVITMTGLREAPLPMIPIPRLRASLDVWGAVTRAAWFVGYSGAVESRAAVAARARQVAMDLHRLAHDGPVMVIGHGIFNVLVAARLRRLGWSGPRVPSFQHGAVSRFSHEQRSS